MYIDLEGYDWSRVKGFEDLSEEGREELAELTGISVCDRCGRPIVYEQYHYSSDVCWCSDGCMEEAIGWRKWYLEYHDAGNGRPDRSLEPSEELPDAVRRALWRLVDRCADPAEFQNRLDHLVWFGLIPEESEHTFWTDADEELGGEVAAFLDQLHWDDETDGFKEETR